MREISLNEITRGDSGRGVAEDAQVALLYHELRGKASAYSYALAKDQFESQLALFCSIKLMESHYSPLITFDDGHLSDFEYALPALSAKGMSAHFFITAGWTGTRRGYMEPQHLRVLHATGHVIGAHGWSHTLLTRCTATDLHRELHDAKAALEDCISAEVTDISLPGGRGNASVMRACREAGYKRVWTSSPSVTRTSEPTVIGRFNVLATHSEEFLSRLLDPASGLLRRVGLVSRVKGVGQRVLGDSLYAKLWAVLNHQESSANTEPAGSGK